MIDESIAVLPQKPTSLEGTIDPTSAQLEEFIKQHPEYRIPTAQDNKLTAFGEIRKLLSNDFVRGVLQANPEWVREKIEAWGGDYTPIILPWVEKSYPDLYDAVYPSEERAGNKNSQQIGRNTQERSNKEFEGNEDESISKEIWEEILLEIVRLTDEGNSPGKIKDFIYDDYGVELTHQQIMKDVQRFKQSLKAQQIAEAEERAELEAEQAEEEKRRQNAQKKVLSIADENKRLTERIHELEKELAIIKAVEQAKNPTIEKQQETQHRGLIRTALHYLY